MQREEKQLDTSVETLIQKVTDIKTSIATFLAKIETEYETLPWPTVLDNFALISSNVSSLNRHLKTTNCPVFRNYALLPLVLAPDRDPNIEKLTESRVFAFNHEVVPDYLRTKPEPEVEERVNQLQTRVNALTADTIQKHVNLLNKVVTNVLETVEKTREEWESEINQKSQQPQTFSESDTKSLVSAVTLGLNLKSKRAELVDRGQPSQGRPGGQPQTGDQRAGQAVQSVHINKAPSTIKTNIRPGGSSMHPYSRT